MVSQLFFRCPEAATLKLCSRKTGGRGAKAGLEREIIAERTRDKIAASRRKGKYTRGRPVLRYSVVDTKLVVDEAEAKQVLAELAQVSRARMTQIMNLNLLAPELQETLLFLPPVEIRRDMYTLADLQTITLESNWGQQRKNGNGLCASHGQNVLAE